MVEKIILKESMKNLPSWFTKNVDRNITEYIDRCGIDLHNCKFTEISKKTNRAPEFTNGDIVVFGFEGEKYDYDKEKNVPNDYIVLYDDGGRITRSSNAPYGTSEMTRKELLDRADHIAVISFSDESNKKDKNREVYDDPRKLSRNYYSRHQEYAGQKKEYDEWETEYGRDKSGYEIPTPEYWQTRLFNYNFKNTYNKYKMDLDDLYNKIESLKGQLFSTAENKFDISNFSRMGTYNIGKAFDTLREACNEYTDVLNSLDKLKDFRDKGMTDSDTSKIENFDYNYKWCVKKINELEEIINKL